MDDIFLTDRCIITLYSQGSSGKFLINCLSFNSKCQPQTLPVFENVTKQINFLLLKLKYFVNAQQREDWNDLNMGDREFYNIKRAHSAPKNIDRISFINSFKTDLLSQADKNIIPCISQNKYFFREVHVPGEMNFYSSVWPNSKIILLDNYKEYINIRYQFFPDQLKKYLFLSKTFDEFLASDVRPHIKFNCMSFLSWLTFYQEYVKLLEYLELEPENISELKEFYRMYMNFWFPQLNIGI